MTLAPGLRVALVHDWLSSYGGAEQVLLQLHAMFPDAPVYTSVYEPARLPPAFRSMDVRPSFLSRFGVARRNHQAFVPLMPLAFESFDLRGYDLVLSDSHACAKGVVTQPGTRHVCYCYTPMRYAWSHQEEYLERAPLKPLVGMLARHLLEGLRQWDYVAAQGVDTFVADCENVRRRIAKYYRRESVVVYPPVDVDRFFVAGSVVPDDPLLMVGRLVPYKRLDVAVRACTQLSLPLRVIGRGPELSHLQSLAGPTVRFEGAVPDEALEAAYRSCRAVIFPSDEDFGLVPLEAMASGRPVLALDRGGVRETVIPGVTGELYSDGGVDQLIAALSRFDPSAYDPAACRARAEEFRPEVFRERLRSTLESTLDPGSL
ncbi:MAG: glycosyltransferase [Candidatus Dormibacteria bacterium]